MKTSKKYIHIIYLFTLVSAIFLSCQSEDKYVIFLHNRFLETHNVNDIHPEFGQMEFHEIITAFESHGIKVIHDIRKGNVNARTYATKVINQIDSLQNRGIKAQNITIIGISKGGYIAQYVSTLANNPSLNFIFIASFQEADIETMPDINYCGNILSIYDKSDPFGVTAIERKRLSNCVITNFKEIEINTGLGHGFIFKPLKEWIEPSILWSLGNFELDTTLN